MAKHDKKMPIEAALGYVEEARAASREWRAKSWRDHEMYDGDQWTEEDRRRALDAGIDPLTINRKMCIRDSLKLAAETLEPVEDGLVLRIRPLEEIE